MSDYKFYPSMYGKVVREAHEADLKAMAEHAFPKRKWWWRFVPKWVWRWRINKAIVQSAEACLASHPNPDGPFMGISSTVPDHEEPIVIVGRLDIDALPPQIQPSDWEER